MSDAYPEEVIFSTYVPKLPDGRDALVVKVHRHLADGSVVPALSIITEPQRNFYRTKPAFRTHNLKKEIEATSKLDTFRVPNYRLAEELEKVITGRTSRGRTPSIAQLCEDPYVYGADLHIECLVKRQRRNAFEASGKRPSKITTGFLDIETDVVTGDGTAPTIITVTHENRVYTAILAAFFAGTDSVNTFRPNDLAEFAAYAKELLDSNITRQLAVFMAKNKQSMLRKHVAANPFSYEFYVGATVLDLVTWIWSRIHANMTDFIGIWNLDFDIPILLAAIEQAGAKPADILCAPSLPKQYHYVKYQPDLQKTESITKKWHWLHCAAQTQFIDSMCLYAYLRLVKGKETSYALDNVLKVNDLGGKLTFKDGDPRAAHLGGTEWHRYMQRYEPFKYIVYNIWDAIALQLMEWKNDDIPGMVILGDDSRLCKWNRQTRKLADSLYFDALDQGFVTASPSQDMTTEFDRLFPKVGGAVLRPERTIDIGIRVFSDKPDIVTMLHPFTGDADFEAMYPNSCLVGNISKETKISTGYQIEGFEPAATMTYYSMCVSLLDNAVFLGNRFFGLPSYTEMEQRLRDHYKK